MDRFLPASKQKLQKSREEGDIAKSADLTGGVSLLFLPLGVFLVLYVPGMTSYFSPERFFSHEDFSTNNMLLLWRETAVNYLLVSLVVLLTISIAGFFTEVAQTGLLLSAKTIKLDFSRLSLGKGFRRLFGFSEDEKNSTGFPVKLYEILKMGLYVFGGALAALGLSVAAGCFVATVASELDITFLCGILIAVFLLAWTSIVFLYLVGGTFDFLVQRWLRLARLRMDLQEFKRELKDSEGSPEMKQRRKENHQQLLLHGILQGIRNAQVLVTGRAKL